MKSSLVCVVLLVVMPSSAHAQANEPPIRRIELAAGIGLLGGATLGDADANLRSSAPTSGDSYRLFTTASELSGASVIDLRAGFDVTRRFGFEAHALFGHPELRTAISGDAESAPSITAVDRLDHYLIDGGIVVRLDEFRFSGLRPFVVAGAGYLRQLHEGLTVIESGRVFYVGGGARYMIFTRARGVPRAGGLRADVRLNVLTGGVEIDDRSRRHPSVAGSFFLVF